MWLSDEGFERKNWAVTGDKALEEEWRFYEGSGQRRPAFLPWGRSLKKDWKNAKHIHKLLGSLKDIQLTSRRWVNFPYGYLCIVNALMCRSWEVTPALINTKLSGKWSSQDFVLSKLNRRWAFSDKINGLLKLSTGWLLSQWMKVCKELLEYFRACSDWHNGEADFWQAFWVACQ